MLCTATESEERGVSQGALLDVLVLTAEEDHSSASRSTATEGGCFGPASAAR
jgi:hypothetical protein